MPRVVITGIGCVSPNGLGRAAYTAALLEGRSGLSRPAPGLCDDASIPAVGAVSSLDAADVLGSIDGRRVPRVVALAMQACREAIDHAGLDTSNLALSRRTGLLLGTGGGGLAFVEQQYQGYFIGGKASPFAITGGTHGNLSGELSIGLGLRGPSHVISTGCASSTDALGYALMLIRAGRLDAAVVGGADAPLAPGILRGFGKMGVLSSRPVDEPAQACRPFNRDRDGFVLGEGAWMFVVESEQHARERGARPLAEVAGYGSTSDAYHRVQIAPDVEECVGAMNLALDDAGATAADIDSVNLHGTATEMNDRLETLALHRLLGGRAKEVPMSATKSMIGHPQGAGGSAGIAAAILCAQKGFVHPTINLTAPAEECDLDYVPLEARKHRPRYILCNCIAFGSKNSAMVIRMEKNGHEPEELRIEE